MSINFVRDNEKKKRGNPELGNTGNILPIEQSNGLLGLGTPLWLLLTTFPWRSRHDLQPSQLTTVLREREGVSAPKPGVPLPGVTLHIASIT